VADLLKDPAFWISIGAAAAAAASTVYTALQAKVSERARALEHDPSWRAKWVSLRDPSKKIDRNTGQYAHHWVLAVDNVGNGAAFDVKVEVGDEILIRPDTDAGGRVLCGARETAPDFVKVIWNDRDRKHRRRKVPVPARPTKEA
jgi:hypothetical protein